MRKDREEKESGRITRRSGTHLGYRERHDQPIQSRPPRGYEDEYMFARRDERSYRDERNERSYRDERNERSYRDERNERSYRDERNERSYRDERNERSYRDERNERNEHPYRGERNERPYRDERAPQKQAQPTSAKVRGGNAERTVHQLVPYALFCLSVFAGVSFFLRDVTGLDGQTGAFGNFLADFFCGILGVVGFAMPLFMFVLALRWRAYVRKGQLLKKLLLSSSFLVLLSAIIHVFQDGARGTPAVLGSDLYQNGALLAGGGFFGGYVGEYMGYIFRIPGTIILAIPLLIIIGIYLVGMTPGGIWQRLADKQRISAEKRDERRKEMYDGEEPPRKKQSKEAQASQAISSAVSLAVNTWREPRPLEPGEGIQSYVFSDEEDDPILPTFAEKVQNASAENVQTVDIPDDVPEVPISVSQSAPAASMPSPEEVLQGTMAQAQDVPEIVPMKATENVQHAEPADGKSGQVYAPFALPIQPFPTKPAAVEASTPVNVAEPELSIFEAKPQAQKSVPAASHTTDEVLGSFGQPKRTATVNNVYTPMQHSNPAEQYFHPEAARLMQEEAMKAEVATASSAVTSIFEKEQEKAAPVQEDLPFTRASTTPVAPFSSVSFDEDEESANDTLTKEPANAFALFEEKAACVKASFASEETDTLSEPDTTEIEMQEDAEKDIYPAYSVSSVPTNSVPPACVAAPVFEPVGSISESEPERPSQTAPVASSARTFTFEAEPDPTEEPVAVKVQTQRVETELAPREQPIAPTAAFARPVATVAPRVAVQSTRVKAEEPTPEPIIREYKRPPIHLLNEDKNVRTDDFYEEIEETKDILRQTMASFNIRIQDEINYSHGPSVTRYEMRPVAGTSVRSVTNRTEDISLNLASSVRIEAPIPGKPAIGIEVPNKVRETVYMRTMLESEEFKGSTDPLDVPLGLDVGGAVRMCNLAKMPHLLVAGTTGSGKSVCINTILLSLIYKTSPEDLRLILIDPKQIEFAPYENVPHLYMPIVTDMQRAAGALACAVQEMERRFSLIKDVGVRNIEAYNEAVKNDPEREHLPYIVIVIDEFNDLKMSCNNNDPENFTVRIAQKARAAGIHLIIGTQRPSVDVITGKLKGNIPSRIAFMVKQQVDSRTILDVNGAEALTGRGDMLYMATNASDKNPVRIQGAFVSDGELERVISYVCRNNAPVQYNKAFMDQIEVEMARAAKQDRKGDDFDYGDEEEGGEDPKFVEAVELAVQTQKVATSLLQRRLGVGYGRAAKIIDRMEELGLVSAAEGNKPRKILPAAQGYLEHIGASDADADEFGDDFN